MTHILGHSRPELIPAIKERLAAEAGGVTRAADYNITSVYEHVTETEVVRAAEPCVPRRVFAEGMSKRKEIG